MHWMIFTNSHDTVVTPGQKGHILFWSPVCTYVCVIWYQKGLMFLNPLQIICADNKLNILKLVPVVIHSSCDVVEGSNSEPRLGVCVKVEDHVTHSDANPNKCHSLCVTLLLCLFVYFAQYPICINYHIFIECKMLLDFILYAIKIFPWLHVSFQRDWLVFR